MSKFFTLYDISIHAPSRERLVIFLVMVMLLSRFQSTLPHGSDSAIIDTKRLEAKISIHAPSRERLCSEPRFLAFRAISIHAPSRERLLIKPIIQPCSVFQSTLPHGSDFKQQTLRHKEPNFNPRSLTGATARCWQAEADTEISIHAPSRERLYGIDYCTNKAWISIHAPSRERLRNC